MSDSMAVDDVPLTADGRIRLDDPAEYLKRKPKKSILKMKQDCSQDGKERGAHFDEMNILATYHPADKDYGTIKIDEPKTPFNHSDCESEADDTASVGSGHGRRVSLGLCIDPTDVTYSLAHPISKSMSTDDDDDDEQLTGEQLAKKQEFEKKRKAHYNEGAVLKLHQTMPDEDDAAENERME